MNPQALLQKLVSGRDTTRDEMRALTDGIISGEVSDIHAAAIMTALAAKGETAPEIAGCIDSLRTHMTPADLPGAFDIVGTGGDGSGTFNISTTSAFVIAGAGVPVGKHGNRAASSVCGSADVLEALGVRIEISPKEAEAVYSSLHPHITQASGDLSQYEKH
jgi:anthranilate phosphoribosyltransferase